MVTAVDASVPAGSTIPAAETIGRRPLEFIVREDQESAHIILAALMSEGTHSRACPPLLSTLNVIDRSSTGGPLLTNPVETADYVQTTNAFTTDPSGKPAGQSGDSVFIGEEAK